MEERLEVWHKTRKQVVEAEHNHNAYVLKKSCKQLKNARRCGGKEITFVCAGTGPCQYHVRYFQSRAENREKSCSKGSSPSRGYTPCLEHSTESCTSVVKLKPFQLVKHPSIRQFAFNCSDCNNLTELTTRVQNSDSVISAAAVSKYSVQKAVGILLERAATTITTQSQVDTRGKGKRIKKQKNN
jgi:hypothetical protein